MTALSYTARWQTGLVAALALTVLALAVGHTTLVVLALVPLGYAAVGLASTPPEPVLELERSITPERPRPGQVVHVTLSVSNAGDRSLPDVRVVDDPPSGAAVVGGTTDPPALATALAPGEAATLVYGLAPPRGDHAFGTPAVRSRNATATAAVTDTPRPAGVDSFTCETLLDAVPVHDRTVQFVGATPTDDGGSGVEFYATREYRRGDPINRIDWNRYARTGALTTIEYRQERAVTLVFVVDDRLESRRVPPGGGPDSFDLSLYAASAGVSASLEAGNRTGFALLAGDGWVDPARAPSVRRRVEDAAAAAREDPPSPVAGPTSARSHANSRTATSSSSAASSRWGDDPDRAAVLADDLERRLPTAAQVLYCSPLTDATALDLVRRLRARGRAVTVVSPDLSTDVVDPGRRADAGPPSVGVRIARLERRTRLEACRDAGALVVDWDLSTPLAVDLTRALRRVGRGGP
ncbi:DUF58 domain-containing protein [Natronobiforma cellulositropha]|uniref:DUF58 domain-containing protein n=1 Tax=Natronobiforma cellulositropha TaxID=1679076 RepID=UPI0021D5E516|nr:DUF58 domain-containing protein [Natronobiforma cellulositropha]